MTDIRITIHSDDRELIKSLKTNNEAAFNIIYDRYAPLLFIHATKMLQDREKAKDIIQDIFTILWSKRHELNIESNLQSYLYRTVRNRVLDLFAKEKVRLEYQNSLQQLNLTQPSSEHQYQHKELQAIIESELHKLPEQMQRVFLLSRFEHKSYKEISDDMNIAEGTVKKQIYLALKRLRKNLSYIFYIFVTILPF